MALTQTVYLTKANVPSRELLEAAIRRLGFDLKIDPAYKPFESEGFLPCTFAGQNSGFEIHFGASYEATTTFPRLKNEIGPRDVAIRIRWGGDMTECICVLVFSAALASEFGAVVHYENDDSIISKEELLSQISAAMASPRLQRRSGRPAQIETKNPWWKLW